MFTALAELFSDLQEHAPCRIGMCRHLLGLGCFAGGTLRNVSVNTCTYLRRFR